MFSPYVSEILIFDRGAVGFFGQVVRAVPPMDVISITRLNPWHENVGQHRMGYLYCSMSSIKVFRC